MKASPEISFAPALLTVRTVIEPDADNRALEIVIDSEDFYRSSLIQLEGDQAPRTSVVQFRSVPGGSYMISARLLGQGGESRAYLAPGRGRHRERRRPLTIDLRRPELPRDA